VLDLQGGCEGGWNSEIWAGVDISKRYAQLLHFDSEGVFSAVIEDEEDWKRAKGYLCKHCPVTGQARNRYCSFQ